MFDKVIVGNMTLTNGGVKLKANKTYEIFLGISATGLASNNYLMCKLSTDGIDTVGSMSSFGMPYARTDTDFYQDNLHVIVTPVSDITIYPYVAMAAAASVTLPAGAYSQGRQ